MNLALFFRILNFGIRPNMSVSERKAVLISNHMMWLTLTTCLGLSISLFFLRIPELLGVTVFGAAIVSSLLFAMYKGYCNFARFGLLAIMSVMSYVMASALGPESGFKLTCFIIALLSFVMFSHDEYAKVSVGVIMAGTAFGLLELAPPLYKVDYSISIYDLVLIYTAILLSFLIGITLISVFYYKQSWEYEESLNKSLKAVEDIQMALNVSSLVARMRMDGTIFYINDSLSAVTGYSAVDFKNRSFSFLNPDAFESEGKLDDILNAVTAGKTWTGDLELITQTGTSQWISASFVPFHDASADIGAEVILIAHLITQRKTIEDNMRLLNTKLQAKASELTRSNDELEQFAYAVSHDLQQPIRIITNYVGLILDSLGDNMDPKVQPYLTHISAAESKIKSMIDEILNYSRVHRLDNDPEPVDLTPIVRDAVDMCRQSYVGLVIKFKSEPLPLVLAHPVRMKQLFDNIIGNAAKYRRDGIALELNVSFKDADDFWEISVSDNGIGIAEGDLNRVFGIFRRLHTDEEYGGTGIGLALCKRIVEVLGGKIWADSEIAVGSTFHFTLPKVPESV